jgi:hypothetical protein
MEKAAERVTIGKFRRMMDFLDKMDKQNFLCIMNEPHINVIDRQLDIVVKMYQIRRNAQIAL